MRKGLAIVFTIITILALKETIYIFSSTEPDIARKKIQFGIVAISITLPLMIFTLWLWRGKRSEE